MLGVVLTPLDDVFIGLLAFLIKFIVKPSKLEGKLALYGLLCLLRIISKSHSEHSFHIKKVERAIKALRKKLKGDKMTLG